MRERLISSTPDGTSAGPSRPGGRRPADRHYLAVVALEARRLRRQLRDSIPARTAPRPGTPAAPGGPA